MPLFQLALILFALIVIAVIIYAMTLKGSNVEKDEDLIKKSGWRSISDQWYEMDDFCLYLSDSNSKTWVFDQKKKKRPGVIARFDSPLLVDDIEYMKIIISKGK